MYSPSSTFRQALRVCVCIHKQVVSPSSWWDWTWSRRHPGESIITVLFNYYHSSISLFFFLYGWVMGQFDVSFPRHQPRLENHLPVTSGASSAGTDPPGRAFSLSPSTRLCWHPAGLWCRFLGPSVKGNRSTVSTAHDSPFIKPFNLSASPSFQICQAHVFLKLPTRLNLSEV